MSILKLLWQIISLTLVMLILVGCTPQSTPTLMPTFLLSTMMPIPKGDILIVTSAADSGSGTLRQVLSEAFTGDTITFDPAVFPPDAPVTISLKNGLPGIWQGYLTIDASNAGVILDGSSIVSSTTDGLFITSDGNTIQGLHIIDFPANGITLDDGTRNKIGGDRNIGSGPLGQGNLLSSNGERGIGLFRGTSHSTIMGNYIGTDSSGVNPWSNHLSGITIEESSNNIIGPNNIIAYNYENGVEITNQGSRFNTITQNSIHDNNYLGIALQEGNNIEAPSIFEFDLTKGIITGFACSDCIVEIFSDGDNEGEVYEGQTSASSDGLFTFNKGAAFANSHLTASATDVDGNTSIFSIPTLGVKNSIRIQGGNNLPLSQFRPKKSSELNDNRIGAMRRLDVYTESEVTLILNQLVYSDLGLKRIRLTKDWFDWWEVENFGEYSEFNINTYQDQAISFLNINGIKTRYDLVYWDKSIQIGKGYSRFKREDEIQRYIDYVQFIVRHFKGQIDYYELLNEPNIAEGTQQYVKVYDYIHLIKRIAPIIKQEDPDAKIVVGAVTPLVGPAERSYFFDIISSDAMPLIDAVSWHDGGSSPEHLAKFYYSVPSLVKEIKSVAYTNGFKGEFILDEMHWRTPKDPHPTEYDEYGEVASAKYYGRGIVRCLGMDLTAGLALEMLEKLPLMVKVIQNLSTIMAGATPESLPVEIQSEASNITSYSFSLPSGDRLIAIWTDGVALENDPGVVATLTIPGFSVQKVIGYDILFGVEQQLITDSIDGNLVIRDFLIKDYPIIFRLVP